MRRARLTILAVVVIAVVAIALVLLRDSGGGTDTTASGFDERTATAGAVTVKVQPLRVDADGAVLRIVLDTHSVPLDADLVASARLDVGGTRWRATTWDGDGPGGHHREGELRFAAGGPPGGTARLRLSGLPYPVNLSWTLGAM